MSLPENIHATAVVIGEAGVLIRGRAGAGKSALALACITAAMQQGQFACLVGDDRILLSHHNGRLVARPHPALQGRIERRGLAIAALPYAAGTVLRLVVDLVVVSEGVDSPPRLPWLDVPLVALGEIKLPHLPLDARRQRADQTDLIFAALETCPKWD